MLVVSLGDEEFATVVVGFALRLPGETTPKVPILLGDDDLLSTFLPNALFSPSHSCTSGIKIALPLVLIVVKAVIRITIEMLIFSLGIIGFAENFGTFLFWIPSKATPKRVIFIGNGDILTTILPNALRIAGELDGPLVEIANPAVFLIIEADIGGAIKVAIMSFG